VRQYPSPAAFRAAIDTRLRNYARRVGVPVQVVRRQAALERLMAPGPGRARTLGAQGRPGAGHEAS
jgi:hypothetical protein